jgi:CRISPR-associated endonuclease/helicase Cas3
MQELPRHLRYWAKTDFSQPLGYHPVLYHCLDVAAVVRAILEARPRALRRLSQLSGWEEDGVLSLVTFLLACHDVGKMADGFQYLRPQLMERLQGRMRSGRYDHLHYKHDSVGFFVLSSRLYEKGLVGLLSTADRYEREDFANSWLAAVMGHHGVPPLLDLSKGDSIEQQFPPSVAQDLDSILEELRAYFLPDGLSWPPKPGWEDDAKCLSWLLAGLAVEADWLGSGAFFRPTMEDHGTMRYFEEVALPTARQAVTEAGLREKAPAQRLAFADFWPLLKSPTPLQELADTLPLAEGPQIIVIEEITGGGKTEAALTLAHRLIAAGKADGLYFGLPTMATANAMFERVERCHRNFYRQDEQPSLILAHAKRRLWFAQRELRLAEVIGSDLLGGHTGDEGTGRQSAAWLADNRKKALLAEMGVGTIDQGLIGALTCRHQSLRLWGLAGKVLIVDEVHAADFYMREVLKTLLQAHAAFGGSAILLSATLPTAHRARLVRAFAKGAGYPSAAIGADLAYPALLHWSGTEGCAIRRVDPRPDGRRRLAVRLLHDEKSVEAMLAETVEKGGCACWIRNTVGDAIAAWERLSSRSGAENVQLFHARFTVGDRQRIEGDVLERFGPRSSHAQRRGRILIATQVIESSVDVDFDTMISDLAPIDLLIQRAGRLRRHRRDALGNRSQDREGRGEPILYVHSPEPKADCDRRWFSQFLPGAAIVYPDHGRLWLAARHFADDPWLRVPDDLRALVERIYGEDPEVPAALEDSVLKTYAKEQADRSTGRSNSIELAQGYCPSGGSSSWRDDVATPTRLGDPTVTLRLAKRVGDLLVPFHEDPDGWELSEVSVRQAKVAAEASEDAALIEAARTLMPGGGKWALIVATSPEGGDGVGNAIDGAGRRVEIRYSSESGLSVTRLKLSA